ncbi:MAG TPA: acetyl-CoA carboxylase carboxyltransferase subunit alpha [Planctomycetota bacterium]|nr:acetyl-CoA carboxylase carboxyltransferase subunit alpha [Planctomycetota bacterium]
MAKQTNGLDFERPILELEARIQTLESGGKRKDLAAIKALKKDCERLKQEIFSNLSAWETVQVARHPDRPQTSDYIELMTEDFVELHGDRTFSDDHAIVTGFARLGGEKIALIGHQKGKSTKEKVNCYFGCAHPEGYRKALRIMRLAEKFGAPVVTLIDTPGAYPGIGAEERGQAQIIAVNLMEMARLKTPIINVVIAEGGSGGALGIGVGDRLAILQHAYYSVISPEGCAAILWKSGENAAEAAEALRLTAQSLLELGIADDIIPEPLGGAHRDPRKTADSVKKQILKYLPKLMKLPVDKLLDKRYEKLRSVGQVLEGEEADRAVAAAIAPPMARPDGETPPEAQEKPDEGGSS